MPQSKPKLGQALLEMQAPPATATDSNGAEATHPPDGAGESTAVLKARLGTTPARLRRVRSSAWIPMAR